MAEVAVTVETITPAIALSYLEGNLNNRVIRQARVKQYATDMRRGSWPIDGSSIKFNGKNRLLDGQHRLLACVMADKPFTTVVVRGIGDSAHPAIDTGASRTMADELRWRGENNAANLASMLAYLWAYDNGEHPHQSTSHAELLKTLSKNPKLRDSVPVVRVGSELRLRGAVLATVHYMIVREHGQEVADEFVEHLASGVDYVEGDPALALRNYALRMSASKQMIPTRQEWMAVTLKTANAYLLGRTITRLSWRQTGVRKEPYPQLVSKEEAGEG